MAAPAPTGNPTDLADPAHLAEPGAPSDNDSLIEVLRVLAGRGYESSFRPAGGRAALVCGACGAITDAQQMPVAEERRLEGASDPDDLVLAVAATCPICQTGGVLVLGFGPNASPEDADIVVALPAPRAAEETGGDDDDDGEPVADPGGDSDPDAGEGFEAP